MDDFYKLPKDSKKLSGKFDPRWIELIREAHAEAEHSQVDVHCPGCWTRQHVNWNLDKVIKLSGGEKLDKYKMHFAFIHRKNSPMMYVNKTEDEGPAFGEYVECGFSTISQVKDVPDVTAIFVFIYMKIDRLEFYRNKYKLKILN